MKDVVKKGMDLVDKVHTSRDEYEKHVTDRWVADSKSESWLTQSARPIIAIMLTAGLLIGWFIGLEVVVIAGLVGTVLTAFFGARTYEKAQKIAQTEAGKLANQVRLETKIEAKNTKLNYKIRKKLLRRGKLVDDGELTN